MRTPSTNEVPIREVVMDRSAQDGEAFLLDLFRASRSWNTYPSAFIHSSSLTDRPPAFAGAMELGQLDRVLRQRDSALLASFVAVNGIYGLLEMLLGVKLRSTG